MKPYTLNTKIIMRNDTPAAWRQSNPVLAKGEVGCAIDSDHGIVTIKVGDGVYKWQDLEMRLGEKRGHFTNSCKFNV